MQNNRSTINTPKTWGLIYLFLIPIFALIYTFCLPNHFYHSTIQFEKENLNKTKDTLTKNLNKAIIDNYLENHTKPDTIINGFIFNINKIKLIDLDIIDKKLAFILRYNVEMKMENNSIIWIIDKDIKMDDFYFYKKSSIGKENSQRHYFRLDIDSSNYEVFDIGIIFKSTSNISFISNNYILGIPFELSNHVSEYIKTMIGFPAKIDDNFYRMLYFSAITITTIGFGDIVPITSIARLFVAIEAVLGIIIIGLFLNSLTNRMTNN